MKVINESVNVVLEKLDLQNEITTVLADKLHHTVLLINALEQKIELLESKLNLHELGTGANRYQSAD